MPHKKSQFVYGKSPNPTSWHDLAAILKRPPKPSKPSKSEGHLAAIERLLKESKS